VSKQREKRKNDSAEYQKRLEDYVEVKERIPKFYREYPDGRIVTEIWKWMDDGTVVVRALLYRNPEEQKLDLPLAVGHAQENANQGYINKTSALENCETSAVGRALANAGISTDKAIASREEFENALKRIQQMKEDGTFDMPFKVRNEYYKLAKLGVEKGLDKEVIYKLANFVRDGGEWTEEVIKKAVQVVEVFEPGSQEAEKALMKIAKEQVKSQSA